MDIVQTVRAAFMGEATPSLGRMLEEHPQKVQAAISAAVPTVLLLLSGKASHPDGGTEVLSALNERGPAVLDHVVQQVHDGQAQTHSSGGMRRLNRLFGRDSAAGLAYAISRFSGLSINGARTIVGLVGPACLEAVARYVSPQDVPELIRYFGQNQAAFSEAVPAGLHEYLDEIPPLRALSHEYDEPHPSTSTDDAMQDESEFARQENYHNERYYRVDRQRSRPPMVIAWAIPLLIVLAIGAAMMFTLYPRNTSNLENVSRIPPAPPQQTIEGAQPAAARLPGATGPFGMSDLAYIENEPVRTQLTGAFGRMASALNSVRDAGTASNAANELSRVSDDLRHAQLAAVGLPGETQTRLSEEINRALPAITSASERAASQPGGAAIRPVSDRITQQLREMARTRQS